MFFAASPYKVGADFAFLRGGEMGGGCVSRGFWDGRHNGGELGGFTRCVSSPRQLTRNDIGRV